MLKRLIVPAFLLMALASPAAAEVRQLNGFQGVKAEDRLRVEVAAGPQFVVEVTGTDAARIRTRVVDHTLEITQLHRPWFGNGPRLDAVVHVTMPDIQEVAAARGATLIATLGENCHSFSAVAAMGASTTVNSVACDRVDATAAMGAELTLAGTCDSLDVTAAMGAEVRADNLHCRTVDATAAMGGDVGAYASETYDASAAMGGSIDVAGDAESGTSDAVMGGSIDTTH